MPRKCRGRKKQVFHTLLLRAPGKESLRIAWKNSDNHRVSHLQTASALVWLFIT